MRNERLHGGRHARASALLASALNALPGRLVLPDHDDYDAARCIYNRFHDQHPAALLQTTDHATLRAALACARDHGIEVAIRGGGHHIGGLGSSEGGLVLDFSPFTQVTVDPAHHEVHLAPGATLAHLDRATAPCGRVVPGGTVSQTGVAGLALGGGKGWLTGLGGLTCDRLCGAQVMLADGSVHEVDERSDPDLLWALRGGGGNFGLVLQFRFRSLPLPPLTCGSYVVPWRHAAGALADLAVFLDADCPRTITVSPVIRRDDQGAPCVSLDFCAAGADAASLARLREAAGPCQEQDVGRWQHVDWQCRFDADFLPPMRGYWKACYKKTLATVDIEALLAAFERAPRPRSAITIEHLHGAFRDFDGQHAAFGHRTMSFGLLASTRWDSPRDDESRIAWVRDTVGRLDPTGDAPAYVNYSPSDDGRASSLLYGDHHARLAALKRRYDPENLFRRNHNVTPSTAWRDSRAVSSQ